MNAARALLFALALCCVEAQAPIEYRNTQPASAPPETPAPPPPSRAARQPAPIEYRGAGTPSETQSIVQPAPSPPPAQPAPNWADGPGTPLSAYALRPEDVHPFDPAHLPSAHRVLGRQTVYDIATMYQIPLRALIDQNNLSPPYALREGQSLRLPPPRFHTTAPGDTLQSIARRYNVDARSLALLNRLPAPYALRIGQPVVLPATARAVDQSYADPPPAQPVAMTAPSEPARAGHFVWPVRGAVVTRFGAQPGGRRSDGVEIAADEGANFVAADDGEVVYAGADLPAYGALIMIRHEGGWVTAYAYGRRALVAEGARVRRGQPIGEVGQHNGRGMLLFQVRQGRNAADPLPLLASPSP